MFRGFWGLAARVFSGLTGTSAHTLPVRLFRAVSGAFRVGISVKLNSLKPLHSWPSQERRPKRYQCACSGRSLGRFGSAYVLKP